MSGAARKRRGLRVFISYRRQDAPAHAGRLYDRLAERFGADRVFMDVDAIRLGVVFSKAIEQAVDDCDVFLAVIGRWWLTIAGEDGTRRLDQPGDYVRRELEEALRRDIPVLPLLVQDAAMPVAEDLPSSIDGLAQRQAFEVSDQHWGADVEQLIEELERLGRPEVVTTPKKPRPRRRRVVQLGSALACAAIGVLVLAKVLETGGGSDGSQFREPAGIAVGGDGTVYIADTRNSRILEVRPDHRVEPYAGPGPDSGTYGDGGPADQAAFAGPRGLAVHDGTLYVADYYHERVRAIAASRAITTVAGDGQPGFDGDSGDALMARLRQPAAVAVASDGTFYIADQRHHRIRRVGTDGRIITVAGDGQAGFTGDGGPASAASLNQPMGVALSPDGAVLYIADTGNNRIRQVDLSTMQITTLAGGDEATFRGEGVKAGGARLNSPRGLAVSADGSLYIADTGDNRIRKIANGIITTVAGIGGTPGFAGDNGPAIKATLNQAEGVAVSADGAIVYVADTGNNRVRQVADGTIRTLAQAG